jgi:uncharacterized protein
LFPTAFVKYLYHFHVDRDYFECHEILEEYWKEETDQSKNSIWVGFILLAVANYHHRRNNFSGATRTLAKAINILSTQKTEIIKLGFSEIVFFDLLHSHLLRLKENKPYESYTLPILNTVLLNECYSFSELSQLNWGNKSDLSNENLIHRHKLRDRTNVISDRHTALNQRNNKNINQKPE